MIKASEYRKEYLNSGKIMEIDVLFGAECYPIYYDTFNFQEECIEQKIDYKPFVLQPGGTSLETFGPMIDAYNAPLANWIRNNNKDYNYNVALSAGCPRSADICQNLSEVKVQVLEALERRETEKQLQELRKKERDLQMELRKTIRFKSDPRCALLKET